MQGLVKAPFCLPAGSRMRRQAGFLVIETEGPVIDSDMQAAVILDMAQIELKTDHGDSPLTVAGTATGMSVPSWAEQRTA
jgi:hypothetical protein